MEIRTAEKADYEKIYTLVKTAFETAEVSDKAEQDFVVELRAGENYLPGMEFVAEEEGKLVGHIMMTKQQVKTEDGDYFGVLVAPLCVDQSYRNMGLGGLLMDHALQEAVKAGYKAAFLVGNPDYYYRFGYQKSSDFGIMNDTTIPDQFVLACELLPGALKNVKGSIKAT